MKKDSWPVKPDTYHTRTGYCYYCNQPVGAEHNTDCPKRSRTVVAKITYEYLTTVMEDCDAKFFIEQYNCGGNVIRELEELEERIRRKNKAAGLGDNCGCLCAFSDPEYIREATQEDHERFAFEWEDIND